MTKTLAPFGNAGRLGYAYGVQEDAKRAVEQALECDIKSAHAVSGGDINEAFDVTLGDGRRVFAKLNATMPAAMFETEALGLAWLAKAESLRTPEVLAASNAEDTVGFLVLEWIERKPPSPKHDAQFGQGLAALHKSGAPSFGLDHDNFVGRLFQSNTPLASWPEFYILRRLEPMLKMAVDSRRASTSVKAGMQKLFAKMEDRVGDPEPPARLHGDLWSGNAITDERGRPVLIDPAVYGGHREIDLAMMQLFGGFSDAVFSEYHNAYPVADGWRDRIPLYQLYPLMVHVNLFGGHYVDQVEHALRKVL